LLPTSLTIIFEDEAHSIALVQHANARRFKGARVDEYILPAFVGLDKAESLCSLCHSWSSHLRVSPHVVSYASLTGVVNRFASQVFTSAIAFC
jgi:hypothetical protein